MANPIYQGPIGPKGEKGDQGETGAQGPKGDTGAQGPVGPQGPRGEQGPKGADGAFETLTPEQKEELRGPEGKQGPAGPEGKQGIQGPQGPQGIQGIQGEKGPQGDPGDSGVYVGTTEPGADVKVWINPEGEVIVPGGGGLERYVLTTGSTLSNEDKAFIQDYFKYYLENGEFKPIELYYTQSGVAYGKPYNDLYLVSRIEPQWVSSYWELKLVYGVAYNYENYYTFCFNAEGNYIRHFYGSNFVEIPDGGSWIETSDNSDSGLYDATEVYILAYDNIDSNYIFSHIYLGDYATMGNNSHSYYRFAGYDASESWEKYWYYDGSSIVLSSSDMSITTIGYKQ